jgi:PAS domain S-box-containing protein
VTRLPIRLETHAHTLLDLCAAAFLALLWATGNPTLWLYLAFIAIAVGAFLRSQARSTVVRAVVVLAIGGGILLRLHAQGAVPRDELLEIPMMTVLALLFAAFGRRRARAEEDIMRDQIPLATIALDENARVVTWNPTAEQLFGWRADEVIGERDHAQRRYRDLIESLPVVTYIDQVDDHATNVYTSPQVVEMLGWPHANWESDPRFFETLVHPDDADRVIAAIAHANETREQFDADYRLRHQDGHYVWVHDQSTIVEDGGEAFARGFLLDITKQKQLEDQLRQAQKMDALGQFAGGIAHDFNNLLTGIGGYADLATAATKDDTVVSRYLDGIKTAASEAAGLTSRLLAFSRRNVPERRLVDVNAIVREATSLLERLVRSDVHVNLALMHGLPAVAGDLAQLKQVVLNLALNARDAMPDGGTLTIETTIAGDSVILRVRDSGVGMDATTRSRALEPFFTTKPEGEGTGLGLSLVYGVVDALDGRLSIESAVGLGTIVEIALPAVDALPDGPEEADATPPATLSAERVLVVEDRDVVRDLARDVLEASGFDVVAVAGGHEALEEFATGRPFDLLLTDVVMPEMSGPQLAVKLRVKRPELPVLYMSGYTDDVLSAHELSRDATAFLRKPFGNSELVSAARALLDRQPWAPAALANAASSTSASTA